MVPFSMTPLSPFELGIVPELFRNGRREIGAKQPVDLLLHSNNLGRWYWVFWKEVEHEAGHPVGMLRWH